MQVNFEVVLKSLKEYINSIDDKFMKENRNENNDDIVLSDLFTADKNDTSISIKFKKYIETLKSIEIPLEIIPYSEITFLIYNEMDVKRELLNEIDGRLLDDFNEYKKHNDLDKDIEKRFLKVKEHISLSIIQRTHISNSLSYRIGNVDEKLEESEKAITEYSEMVLNIEEKSKEKADKLVVQFITILGIFAAIMMGTMGSFQSFTSIFENAENIPIGKTLIISAAGACGVSLVLFLLLHSISKLTSFSLSNCDCKDKRKGGLQSIRDSITVGIFGGTSKPKCTCSMFNKYPTIFIINYLFYYVAFTGFIFMYFNFNDYFNENFWLQIRVIFYFYFVATLMLLCVHRYLIDKNPNENPLRMLVEDVKKTSNYIKELFQRNV